MSQESQSWVSEAQGRLLELRGDRVGWAYLGAGPAYTEPTAVGCLALSASHTLAPLDGREELVNQSAEWLADLQQPDGAVGISADLETPRWPTSFVALLWSQLSGYERALAQSLTWLQQREGHTFARTKESVLGHDTSIPGWPWVAGTHPWLEPTGLAVLALCRNQLSGHQRIRDGVRMILDRAITTGGWNVGNSSAFGKPLRPQAGSTGLALLALKAALHEETPSVTRACRFLNESLPSIRSPETLGWGLLGLQAWRPKPKESDAWLRQSFGNVRAIRKSPMRLSLLLLAAASSTTLQLLGVESVQVGEILTETATL